MVGVVADVRIVSLDTAARAQLYWPQAQIPGGFMVLFARGDGTGDVAGALRAAVAASDPGIPVARVATLDDVVGESLRRPRFTFVLLGALAGTAALLAALGLFGVLAYSVGQRLPEMGVRLALGATPGDVARLVLGEGARLCGAGLAAGLAGRGRAGTVPGRAAVRGQPARPLALRRGGAAGRGHRARRDLVARAAREPGGAGGGVACGVKESVMRGRVGLAAVLVVGRRRRSARRRTPSSRRR